MIIKSRFAISDARALKILAEKAKNKELTTEQQQAHDFLSETTKLKESNAKKLTEELAQFGLKEEEVLNILNIVPTDEAVLKMILKDESGQKKEIKKILEIVAKYA